MFQFKPLYEIIRITVAHNILLRKVMNKKILISIFITLFSITHSIADTSNTENILIIYGHGLTPTYDDVRVTKTLFSASELFSNEITSILESNENIVKKYSNTNADKKLKEYLPYLLSEYKSNKIIIVRVVHEIEPHRTIYLKPQFLNIKYFDNGAAKFTDEITERYDLAGTMIIGDPRIKPYAMEFIKLLKDKGAI